MKRLFWKEWYEKKLWLVVFFAFVAVAPFLSRDGFCFCGRIETTSMWVFVLVAPALLLGLSTFSSETRNECQNFLFSRAIGWKRILGAKVLVDICIMLAAIIAGAIFFWLGNPLDYLQYVGFYRFLAGIGIAFGVSLIGYLPGFGASFVLPGLLGGGLVIFLTGVIIKAEISILTTLTTSASIPYALGISWVVALVAASIILTKRDVGISVKERVKKYGIYTAAISSAMLIFAIPISIHYGPYPEAPKTVSNWNDPEKPMSESDEKKNSYGIDVSPDGKYLLECVEDPDRGVVRRVKLIRLLDGKVQFLEKKGLKLPNIVNEHGWYKPDSLILFPSVNGKWVPLIKLHMDNSGNIVQQTAAISFDGLHTYLSPSGSYAAIIGVYYERTKIDTYTTSVARPCMCIIDVRNMKQIFSYHFTYEATEEKCRWDSENDLHIVVISGNTIQRQYHHEGMHISADGSVQVKKAI